MPRRTLRALLVGALGIMTLVVLTVSPASASNEVVQKWLTTSDLNQHLAPQPNLGFSASSAS